MERTARAQRTTRATSPKETIVCSLSLNPKASIHGATVWRLSHQKGFSNLDADDSDLLSAAEVITGLARQGAVSFGVKLVSDLVINLRYYS
jgi:hypothetical protein